MAVLKVGPNDRGTLTKIAASLRRRADQIEPAYSTRQIIDACFPGTVVTGRRLPAVCHEVTMVDEAAFRSHRAPHAITYRRGMSAAEQRYAIAHGVAHIIFDGPEHVACGAASECEARCDRFADELLVPLNELRPYVCRWPSEIHDEHETYLDMVDQIASHFHVTSMLIDQRIRELRR